MAKELLVCYQAFGQNNTLLIGNEGFTVEGEPSLQLVAQLSAILKESLVAKKTPPVGDVTITNMIVLREVQIKVKPATPQEHPPGTPS